MEPRTTVCRATGVLGGVGPCGASVFLGAPCVRGRDRMAVFLRQVIAHRVRSYRG